MTAHYRKGENGTEIYLIEVEGGVRLVTPGETVFGDYGRYIIDEERVELTGEGLLMESHRGTTRLTARDRLEYYLEEDVAVARGGARVVRDEQELNADIIRAYFKPGESGNLEVARVEAEGHVGIRGKGDYATGDRAVYYVGDDRVTLQGNVTVTRGENELKGAFAEVNLASGISRLTGGAPGSGTNERVQGLIVPKSVGKKSGDEPAKEGN